jgi:acetyltransferase-like isoleucine patch superfamily enzyme
MNKNKKSFKFFFNLKLIFCFLFGISIGRICYTSDIFKSKYFSRPGSIGWRWLFSCFIWQKIRGINKHVPWPVSFRISITCPENIVFHPDDLNNFMTHGSYFQALNAKLIIGKGTYIAPNVGIFTENHDINDLSKRAGGEDVKIGEKCWIGYNSVILPGVELGNNTIVGAGSIVTKSFIEGNCVIAGNPARIIKETNINNE